MIIFHFLYHIFISALGGMIWLASFFHPKARTWVNGRNTQILPKSKNSIWFHCASLGEYLQAEPVIQKLNLLYPDEDIVISFFSPSGYDFLKNKSTGYKIFYLPLDTRKNALTTIQNIKPSMVFFVKNELWHNHLRALHEADIPIYFIAFKVNLDSFLPRYFPFFIKKSLEVSEHIFTINKETTKWIKSKGINNVSYTGDTRIDAILARKQSTKKYQKIEKWLGNDKVLVLGSIYPSDLEVIGLALTQSAPNTKVIVVPHEIDIKSLNKIAIHLPKSLNYTQHPSSHIPDSSSFLIVDTLGMLFDLYSYADLVYIGGGFQNGIHNTLEPAAFGKPLAFGPKFHSFDEAVYFIKTGIAKEIKTHEDFQHFILSINNEKRQQIICKEMESFFIENKGASSRIIDYFYKKKPNKYVPYTSS